MTLFNLRQFAEARDALLEAILIKTDYPLAYYHLGGVYREGLSDRRSARNAYRRYLELDPKSRDAAQVREWLQEIERPLPD
jgi:tetratricopeptide (TPR) repeat protein